jgi:hypothetical protein
MDHEQLPWGLIDQGFGIMGEHLKRRKRNWAVVNPKSDLCYFAVREVGKMA